MFWKLTALSASSPVESVLDKENFTLDELLDEEEIIQECKALNGRLINFLRDRTQVEQLLRYVVEEASEDADSKRAFKFPFISCEIFTCEIDVILRTLVEEDELMDLLFSFLEPDRPHSTLLAGYFSKVVVCLMLRKTVPLMNYVQAHQDVFRKLVDLIGITSIMEVLIRLVGADDHMYSNSFDIMQWLADSNLLEMIVDKLNPSNPPEVHANAAETLCAITRNAPSALATKLSSPSFVARIFSHALEDSHSKSGLVNSLSVCISLLDPKRSFSPLMHSIRSQHMYELPVPVNPETIGAMLPKLADLLMLLNLSSDEKFLPTTYGELRPPLGKHRLKCKYILYYELAADSLSVTIHLQIVEFIAVLLRTSNDVAEGELVRSGTIKRVLDLFFEYPYNNMLHHHVESIILSSLESKNAVILDHLFQECDLIGKILQTDKQPALSGEPNQPTLPAAGRKVPRVGNIGHITRISNRIVQLGSSNSHIQSYLQGNASWGEWQSTFLQERNAIENVYRWTCGRPTALQDRTRDSDEEDFHDRDYDVAALANDISRAFNRSKIDENDEEDHGAMDRDDEDVYFDDESAEVVISSLRLGDDQGSLFTNSNWFAFQDDRFGNSLLSTSHSDMMDDINLNGTANGGNSSSDDEVVVGEDEELTESKDPTNVTSTSNATNLPSGSSVNGSTTDGEIKNEIPDDLSFFRFDTPDSEDLFADRPLPDWVGWGESSDLQIGGPSTNPFDNDNSSANNKTEAIVPNSSSSSEEAVLPNGTSTPGSNSSDGSTGSDASQKTNTAPSLFEEDVEFVGVELEGTEKAMGHALKEGIVGEAGPLKRNLIPKVPEKEGSDESGSAMKEFNDANYWRVDQEVAVLE
ncbi:SIT4 phosphatase-associated protein family [Dillenia turbinata]|uniref:SIT4 phosphatase-associated protein family n=1 Tax=Dillenia turbinata TaxID=194707 RepID=A0AAN8VG00_9MAGN